MKKKHWYLLSGIDEEMAVNGRKELSDDFFWFRLDGTLYGFIKMSVKDAIFTSLYLVKRNIFERSQYYLKRCV